MQDAFVHCKFKFFSDRFTFHKALFSQRVSESQDESRSQKKNISGILKHLSNAKDRNTTAF